MRRERDYQGEDNADWKTHGGAWFGDVTYYKKSHTLMIVNRTRTRSVAEMTKLSTDLTAALAWAQRQGKEGAKP